MRNHLLLGLSCCLLLVPVVNAVWAMPASDLQNLRVADMIYSTQVLTAEGHMRVSNPDAVRLVVLRISADKPNDAETRIFAHDFLLSYQVDGEEQRARIEAISGDPGSRGDFGVFSSAMEPRAMVSGQKVEFGLVAVVENSVSEAQLLRVGTAEATPVVLPERRFSIFLSTSRGMATAEQVAGLLQAKGYQVATSDRLPDQTGVVVKYGEQTEDAAQQLKALLENQFGWTATLTQLDDNSDICEYDMLLWIGN